MRLSATCGAFAGPSCVRQLLALAIAACAPGAAVTRPVAVREASLAFSTDAEDECSQTVMVADSAGVARLEWIATGGVRLIVREAARYVGVTKATNRVETNTSCSEAVFVGTVRGARLNFDRVAAEWHWSGSAEVFRSPTRRSQLQLTCSGALECRATGLPETLSLPASTPWSFGRHLAIERLGGIESARYDDRPLGAEERASLRRCYP